MSQTNPPSSTKFFNRSLSEEEVSDLLNQKSVRESVLKDTGFFEKIIEQNNWEMLNRILSQVGNDPFFLEKMVEENILGKIIENYPWEENPDEGFALVQGFLKAPGTVGQLTEAQIVSVCSIFLQYGNEEDIDFLQEILWEGSEQTVESSKKIYSVYSSQKNTKPLIEALLKNPISWEEKKKSELFKMLFHGFFQANPYKALESLTELDKYYLEAHINQCLVNAELSSVDAMSVFAILLSYKNLKEIESALDYSSIKCEFLAEDENYPFLLHNLLKNPDREVFNTYFPILYEFNPSIMRKALWELEADPFVAQYIKKNAIPLLQADAQADKADYEAYQEKLQAAKERKVGDNLELLLSSQDRMDLLNIALYETPFLEKGQMFRLEKERTLGPRTLVFHRLDSGEYRVIVETKSKTAFDQKIPNFSKGGSKKGKDAYDLITEEELYNLSQSPPDLRKAMILGKEVSLAKALQSTRIHTPSLGRFFLKDGRVKISSYASRATSDLRKFLEEEFLTNEQRHQLIWDLLWAVKAMHDKHVCHQDIKPENILIFKKGDELELKLCDLEFAGEKAEICGTLAYFSPEMVPARNAWDAEDRELIKKSFAFQCYKGEESYREEADAWYQAFAWRERPLAYGKDMWAVGITSHEILFGTKPHLSDYAEIMLQALFNLLFSARIADREDINKIIIVFAREFKIPLDEAQLKQLQSDVKESRKTPIIFKPSRPAPSRAAPPVPPHAPPPVPAHAAKVGREEFIPPPPMPPRGRA